MTLTPIAVERTYVGVTTSVMYLTPLGIEAYATPGERYLVYGRNYRPPDIVMASPGIGAKAIAAAGPDLAFLDALVPGHKGGTITGLVQFKDVTYDRQTRAVSPLDGIVVRIFNDEHSIETVTGADGGFHVSVPAGQYELAPQLPDDLVVWDSTSRIRATVGDAGCRVITIDTLFNGRVRGILRGPDGRPLTSTSVDLMPIDIEPEPTTGQIKGTGSVSTNEKGEFEFAGRPAGRYYLGVSLYNAPNPNGPSYPRTYYPGTTDRNSAVPVVVGRGVASDGLDFSIPMILPKGDLEVIIETEYAGKLTLCYLQLDDLFARRSSHTPPIGVPHRLRVVDGQRYEVHVHLEFPGGHLESEPFVFTATTGRTVVKLRPDSPRTLHR
jgi:hypothetical protein